jgi:DNA-directed RNA polymerase I, II, and III subunit RPABC2
MSSKIYFENEGSDTETDNGSVYGNENENENENKKIKTTRGITGEDSDIDDADVSDDEKEEDDIPQDVDVDVDVDVDLDVDDATLEGEDGDGDDSDIMSDNEDDYGDEKEEVYEEEYKKPVKGKKSKKTEPKKQLIIFEDNDDDDDENDGQNENYLEKFDADLVKSYIEEFHPECVNHNYDEIAKLSYVVKNSDGIIIDPLHKTIPYLTKYERARVLGQRSKQIETGGNPFVKVPENIIDAYIIAELELKEKKIPFIIKRPLPGGGCEYWNLKDLEIIAY